MSTFTDLRLRKHIPTATSAVLSTPKHSRTVTYLEIPLWQRDNDFIWAGYRQIQNHWSGCFVSVFAYLHNETVNIHSHLWGAVLFVYFLATFYQSHLEQHAATWTDWAVLAVFLSSAVFCLLASAFFHTSTCHSERVAARCHALDYSGIVILTVGSFYPAIHFGFFCYPRIQIFYILLLSCVGLGAAYIVLSPDYAKPTHRGARTGVFIVLGLSGVIPVAHCFLIEGYRTVFLDLGFSWMVLSGAFYIFGALLYANRIPECLAPGKFDYFFASHQIFHFFVIAAAGAHYIGVLRALKYCYSRPDTCAALSS